MIDKYTKIRASGLKIMDIYDISIILNLPVSSTRVIASRLASKGILTRLKKNLYILSETNIYDYEIANRLITPSYISFESALNYWGITTQIPEEITSAAKRSFELTIRDQTFTYHLLRAPFFNFGFILKDKIYIATPEKALLDMILYSSSGRKSLSFDNFYLDNIDKEKLIQFSKIYPSKIKKFLKELLNGPKYR